MPQGSGIAGNISSFLHEGIEAPIRRARAEREVHGMCHAHSLEQRSGDGERRRRCNGAPGGSISVASVRMEETLSRSCDALIKVNCSSTYNAMLSRVSARETGLGPQLRRDFYCMLTFTGKNMV